MHLLLLNSTSYPKHSLYEPLPLSWSVRNGRWPHRPRWRSFPIFLRRVYPEAPHWWRRSVRSEHLLLGPPRWSPIFWWRNITLPLLDWRTDSRDFFIRLRNRVRFSIFVRYYFLFNITWTWFLSHFAVIRFDMCDRCRCCASVFLFLDKT